MHDYIAQHGITAVMSCHANPTYLFHVRTSLHTPLIHTAYPSIYTFRSHTLILHTSSLIASLPSHILCATHPPKPSPTLHTPTHPLPSHPSHLFPSSHNSQTFPSITQLTHLPLPHTTHTSSPPHTFHPFPWYPLTNNSTIPSNGMHSLTYPPGDTQRGLSTIEGDPSHHVNGSRGGCMWGDT